MCNMGPSATYLKCSLLQFTERNDTVKVLRIFSNILHLDDVIRYTVKTKGGEGTVKTPSSVSSIAYTMS